MRACILLLIGAWVAGCAMVGSSPIERMAAIGCTSDAGAYYLSKTFLEIQIDKWGLFAKTSGDTAKPIEVWHEIRHVSPKRKPDREHGYCLDYLSSLTADEKVWIRKDSDYLLTLVSTQSIDQSAYIIKALTGAFFQSITAGRARSRSLASDKYERRFIGVAFKGEYDPLDQRQTAVINRTITDLDFCLILENDTFDAQSITIDAYCSDPYRAIAGKAAARIPTEAKPTPLSAAVRGIAYRPRVPHNYYLFVRGPNGWELRQSESISLESRKTVINVGIDRSFFANRKSALIFEKGTLRNICIYKSSELAELSTIPLAIAQNIAALPANVIQLRIDNTNNYERLVAAESALLKAQQTHLDLLSGGTTGAAAPAAAQSTTQKAFTFAPVGTAKREEDVFTQALKAEWNKICPDEESLVTTPATISTGAVITVQPIGPTP